MIIYTFCGFDIGVKRLEKSLKIFFPECNIVCFRLKPKEYENQTALLNRLNDQIIGTFN